MISPVKGACALYHPILPAFVSCHTLYMSTQYNMDIPFQLFNPSKVFPAPDYEKTTNAA